MAPKVRGALLDDLLRAAESAGFDARAFRSSGATGWHRLQWVAAEQQVLLDEAIAAALGLEAVTDIGREAATVSLQSALLRPLADGALRFFGRRPYALFRWAPSFWRVATSGLGQLRVDELPGGSSITFTDLPPTVASSLAWRAEIRGRLFAGVDIVGGDSQVVEVPTLAVSTVQFRVHWSC